MAIHCFFTVGSVIAVLGMPLTAVVARRNVNTVRSENLLLSSYNLCLTTILVGCLDLPRRLVGVWRNDYLLSVRHLEFPAVYPERQIHGGRSERGRSFSYLLPAECEPLIYHA